MATCLTFERAVEIADLHNWAFRLAPHRHTARLPPGMIQTTFKRTGGDQMKTAEILGVSRSTLHRHLRKSAT